MEFLNSIMQHAKSVNDYIPTSFYVYVGLIDGQVAYVGKGTRGRYKHLLSSKSNSRTVTKAKSEGKRFDVYILCDWLSDDEARALETSTIKGLKPSLNLELHLDEPDPKRNWIL